MNEEQPFSVFGGFDQVGQAADNLANPMSQVGPTAKDMQKVYDGIEFLASHIPEVKQPDVSIPWPVVTGDESLSGGSEHTHRNIGGAAEVYDEASPANEFHLRTIKGTDDGVGGSIPLMIKVTQEGDLIRVRGWGPPSADSVTLTSVGNGVPVLGGAFPAYDIRSITGKDEHSGGQIGINTHVNANGDTIEVSASPSGPTNKLTITVINELNYPTGDKVEVDWETGMVSTNADQSITIDTRSANDPSDHIGIAVGSGEIYLRNKNHNNIKPPQGNAGFYKFFIVDGGEVKETAIYCTEPEYELTTSGGDDVDPV